VTVRLRRVLIKRRAMVSPEVWRLTHDAIMACATQEPTP